MDTHEELIAETPAVGDILRHLAKRASPQRRAERPGWVEHVSTQTDGARGVTDFEGKWRRARGVDAREQHEARRT